jgi:AraC family transcriptional regulator, positive regulator of tynA and feaB
MHQSDNFLGTEPMDYAVWRDLIRPLSGRINVEGVEPNTFAGWLRPLHVSGLKAVDICGNAPRYERTDRNVRLDDRDHYRAAFQVTGQSTIYQNDRAVHLTVGDVTLVDATRPITCVCEHGSARWLLLALPRPSLVSHLGFEPQGGACRRSGTPAGRLLYEVVLHALKGGGSTSPPVDSYMQLAVYNLLGALFAPPDPPQSSPHGNKLFMRISGLIKDRFADPDFGAAKAASEAGISLRYLQKLFMQRGITCTDFIYSLRLNQAARLLDRRKLLGINDPISAIAYACGFRDYTHFARKFRQRFGYSPRAYSGAQDLAGNGAVRPDTSKSASLAHDAEPTPI